MKNLIILNTVFCSALAALFLGGCSTTQEIITPDGTSHQLVSCALLRDCYADSAKACGGKYKVINHTSESISSEGSASDQTKLLIKCDSTN